MLVEVFLKLCNAKIFKNPMTPSGAGAYCERLRQNRNWRVVESAPVMAGVWKWTRRKDFAFRRILALDQGTTSSRVIVYDGRLRPLASAQKEFAQHFPQPGWVAHDAMEIWETVLATAREAIAKSGAPSGGIAAIGITNQRETIVVRDRKSGEPIHRAIVWQDRRTGEYVSALREAGKEVLIQQRTGQWDPELLALFDIPAAILPRIVSSSRAWGRVRRLAFRRGAPYWDPTARGALLGLSRGTTSAHIARATR